MRNFLKAGIPKIETKKETSSSSSDEEEVLI